MANTAEAQREQTGNLVRKIIGDASGTIAMRLCTIGDHLKTNGHGRVGDARPCGGV